MGDKTKPKKVSKWSHETKRIPGWVSEVNRYTWKGDLEQTERGNEKRMGDPAWLAIKTPTIKAFYYFYRCWAFPPFFSSSLWSQRSLRLRDSATLTALLRKPKKPRTHQEDGSHQADNSSCHPVRATTTTYHPQNTAHPQNNPQLNNLPPLKCQLPPR